MNATNSFYLTTTLPTTSTVRRPTTFTLGCIVTESTNVTDFTTPPSGTVTLTSDQKTAIGWTGSLDTIAGLGYITGAKLQQSSSSSVDLAAWVGRVEPRIDSNGSITLFLLPSILNSFTSTNKDSFSEIYTQSSNNYPYLVAGTWYLYITFFLSPYVWF